MTDDADLVQRLRRTYRKEYAPTGSTVGDISNRLRPFPILATEVLFNPDGREAADRIEAQAAEIERLRDYWYRQGKDDQHQVDADRIEHLRGALAFYGRENSWKSCGMYMSGRPNPSPAEIDGGKKARAALEQSK